MNRWAILKCPYGAASPANGLALCVTTREMALGKAKTISRHISQTTSCSSCLSEDAVVSESRKWHTLLRGTSRCSEMNTGAEREEYVPYYRTRQRKRMRPPWPT